MVLEKLRMIICNEFEIDKAEIETNVYLIDLGFDELDIADLCMSVEDEFEIEVTSEAAEEFKTIGDVVKYIEENI